MCSRVGRVEVHARLEHPIDHTLEHTRPPLGSHRTGGGQVAHRPHHVSTRPGRPSRGDTIQHLSQGECVVGRAVPGHTNRTEQAVGGPAERGGFVVPPCHQIRDPVAGLAGAGVDCGLPRERSAFPRRRVATLTRPELGHLTDDGGVDLDRALRQYAEEVVGDTGNLGVPVHHGLPGDPEPLGHPGPQRGLVQAPEHPLVPFQVAGIQRPPPPIRCLHPRRDHGVGVHLGVIGTRRRLAERGHRQPVHVREHPGAVHPHACGCPKPLEMGQGRRHGLVMHFQDPRVTGEGPQDTHRLRSRERRIEPRHRPHQRAVGAVAVNQRRTQR